MKLQRLLLLLIPFMFFLPGAGLCEGNAVRTGSCSENPLVRLGPQKGGRSDTVGSQLFQ